MICFGTSYRISLLKKVFTTYVFLLNFRKFLDSYSTEHLRTAAPICWYLKRNIFLFVKTRKQPVVFFLILSVPEKLKILIFEMPIITQTLNINNLRTTSAKSINLHTIRKLVEYSLKNVAAKAMFTLSVFEILLSEGRSVLSPAQRSTGSETVNVMNNLFLYF